MKAIYILVFVIALGLTAGMVNELGIFTAATYVEPPDVTFLSEDEFIPSTTDSGAISVLDFAWGFAKSVVLFFKALSSVYANVVALETSLGIESTGLANVINVMLVLILGLAAIQILRGIIFEN